MLVPLLAVVVLVALTVLVHAVATPLLWRSLIESEAKLPTRTWPRAWLLIRLAWCLILLHVAEISLWALAYLWAGCLPDAESAFYFSGATYTTIGYGDVVLAKPWRILGPVEGLTGILMCGLSASLFFSVVSRIRQARSHRKPE